MHILINGLGCTVTGSRVVLDEIIRAGPPGVRLTVIVPIVPGSAPFDYPGHVKLIKLRHSLWGMYLRIFAEIAINVLMAVRRFDLLINVSSYGLCFTRRQLLYIHNPMILDLSAEKKLGKGNANGLTRMALNTFLRSGEAIFVQTKHMYSQLVAYCEKTGVAFPRVVTILKPPFPQPAKVVAAKRKFEFQFFYPVSPFPHKRGDLAIEAVGIANSGTGLVITLAGQSGNSIEYIGPVSLREVHSQFMTADALLFTSEKETLGLPLLEAMYYDKPAVLPRKDYATEIYGGAGVYYDNDSPHIIAAAIKELQSNYKEYQQKTRDRKQEEMKSRSSWQQHWDAFLGVIKS